MSDFESGSDQKKDRRIRRARLRLREKERAEERSVEGQKQAVFHQQSLCLLSARPHQGFGGICVCPRHPRNGPFSQAKAGGQAGAMSQGTAPGQRHLSKTLPHCQTPRRACGIPLCPLFKYHYCLNVCVCVSSVYLFNLFVFLFLSSICLFPICCKFIFNQFSNGNDRIMQNRWAGFQLKASDAHHWGTGVHFSCRCFVCFSHKNCIVT